LFSKRSLNKEKEKKQKLTQAKYIAWLASLPSGLKIQDGGHLENRKIGYLQNSLVDFNAIVHDDTY